MSLSGCDVSAGDFDLRVDVMPGLAPRDDVTGPSLNVAHDAKITIGPVGTRGGV